MSRLKEIVPAGAARADDASAAVENKTSVNAAGEKRCREETMLRETQHNRSELESPGFNSFVRLAANPIAPVG